MGFGVAIPNRQKCSFAVPTRYLYKQVRTRSVYAVLRVLKKGVVNLEFTNENLRKMRVKKMVYNEKYSKWYYGISQEQTEKLVIEKYKKRSDRILSCLNLWHWNKYELNKVLDLQSVNRCNNTRFCPNCKLLDISKFIHEFRGVYEDYIKLGYSAYMMTLTIPSVSGEKLSNTITDLNKAFRKLIEKYSYSSLDKRSYGDRLFKLEGGIKVLEITYNEKNGFHPHFHCVVFTNYEIDIHLLKPLITGKYSTKRKQVDKKNLIEQQLSQIWSMIWYKERLTKKNIYSIDYDLSKEYFKDNKKVLEVDFRELDEGGIYEVFKYTFKDTHIKNYPNYPINWVNTIWLIWSSRTVIKIFVHHSRTIIPRTTNRTFNVGTIFIDIFISIITQ